MRHHIADSALAAGCCGFAVGAGYAFDGRAALLPVLLVLLGVYLMARSYMKKRMR